MNDEHPRPTRAPAGGQAPAVEDTAELAGRAEPEQCTGLRETRARRTRALLQDAALHLALDKGYEATTVDEVAAAAGVSRRTVFNYFPTKADLFLPALTPPTAEEINNFIDSSGDILTDLADFLAFTSQHAEDAITRFQLFRQLIRENPQLAHEAHERVREFHDLVADAVAKRLGTSPDDLKVHAITALTSAIHKSAIDLWSTPKKGTPAGAAPTQNNRHDSAPDSLVDAIYLMTHTLRDVLAATPSGNAPGKDHT